jgi:hypothetical protein
VAPIDISRRPALHPSLHPAFRVRRVDVAHAQTWDAKRQFVLGHVERVIYNRYEVAIVGSVPVPSAPAGTKLPFRIEGRIDIKAIRSEAGRRAALQAMKALAADALLVPVDDQPVLTRFMATIPV